jgi:hypothetical protein
VIQTPTIPWKRGKMQFQSQTLHCACSFRYVQSEHFRNVSFPLTLWGVKLNIHLLPCRRHSVSNLKSSSRGNNCCLFWAAYETHKYSVWVHWRLCKRQNRTTVFKGIHDLPCFYSFSVRYVWCHSATRTAYDIAIILICLSNVGEIS